MKRFGPLQAFYLSFFSADLYQDVARNWKGIGLLYLLLLLAITWIPSGYRTFTSLRSFATENGAALAQQMPRVTIGNGEMRTEPSGRHELRAPSTGEIFCVIDDTIERVPNEAANDMLVLTRREVGTFQRNDRRVWKLQPGINYDVSRADVEQFLARLPYWAAPLAYAGGLAGSFAFRLLQALLYGTVGMWFAKRLNAGIDYRTAVRLAAVAMTPVIILRTMIWFMPTEPAWYLRWPVALVVTVLLIRFGVRAAAQAEPSATAPAYTGGPLR